MRVGEGSKSFCWALPAEDLSRPVVEFVLDCSKVRLGVDSEVGVLGKYWRSRPLVFSFEPRRHGDRGSQKYTAIPLASVNPSWLAISTP